MWNDLDMFLKSYLQKRFFIKPLKYCLDLISLYTSHLQHYFPKIIHVCYWSCFMVCSLKHRCRNIEMNLSIQAFTHTHSLWLCREKSHDALGCIICLFVLGWWRCYGNRGGGEGECDLKKLKMFGNRGDGFPQWPSPHQPITESVWEPSFSLSQMQSDTQRCSQGLHLL